MPDIEPNDEQAEEGNGEPAGGGRPVWLGTVSFGLVSVPVVLLSAHRPKKIALHMVSTDGHPLSRRYFRADTTHQLAPDDIVRGYEVKKGKFVTIEDDELERLAPEKTRDIDLRVFVPADEIDPIYFERAYYLAPDGGNTKAYKLLARVMEESGRAGIATFVMREKEYLAAILAEKGILRVETLRFANEVRSPKYVGLPRPAKPKPADVKRVESAIKRLARASVDKRELVDPSIHRMEKLAKKKARAGDDVVKVTVPEQDAGKVVDLVERLRESLRKGGGGKKGRARAS